MVMVKPALPYLDVIRRVKDATRPAGRRLQRQRRVRDGQGRRRRRLPRRARRRARGADRRSAAPAPTSSSPTTPRTPPDGFSDAQGPLAQGRRGDPARRLRQAPAQPDAGLASRSSRGPYAAVAAALERRRGATSCARVQRAARRAHHPPGHADLRHARARLRLDARRGQGRPRAPVARRRSSSTPTRASAHNYLRNHDFNLWFTLAVEPDSALGLEGTLDVLAGADRRRVDPPAADAQAVQDPHGPRDGGRHRRAGHGRRGRRAASSSTSSPTTSSTSPSSAPRRATCRSSPSPTRPPPRELGMTGRRAARAPARRCASAALLRRVAAILFHRRAGFSANGMGVWKVPEDQHPRDRAADGRLPRHLALLPAPDLRRLALLGLHDGPRALQGGVRRDPRRDRRRDTGIEERATLYSLDRVQEGPAALLHRRLQALGTRARGV